MYKQAITRRLAEAQEAHARTLQPAIIATTLYTLYTEYRENLAAIVARYFDDATIFDGVGLWQGAAERSAVIEILASETDLQTIANLAGDIKHANEQAAVLITWSKVSTLLVDSPEVRE